MTEISPCLSTYLISVWRRMKPHEPNNDCPQPGDESFLDLYRLYVVCTRATVIERRRFAIEGRRFDWLQLLASHAIVQVCNVNVRWQRCLLLLSGQRSKQMKTHTALLASVLLCSRRPPASLVLVFPLRMRANFPFLRFYLQQPQQQL